MSSARDKQEIFKLFFVTDKQERRLKVQSLTEQTIAILKADFSTSEYYQTIAKDLYRSNTLDTNTLSQIATELKEFINERLEDILWVSSLLKGNEKGTHLLSELLKYEVTKEDLKSMFTQFIMIKFPEAGFEYSLKFGS